MNSPVSPLPPADARPSLLLHVGYHKTATTWLQKRLFQPAHGFRQLADHQEISDLVERPVDLAFDPAPMRALIAGRTAALAPGEAPVVSSEILSGHPYQAGRDNAVLARRLARIAPGARILISIRAQDRMLPSVYMQYMQRGGSLSPAAFFAGTTEPNYFGFDPVHFEYDRLLGLYQELFGAENVFVLPQEDLRRDMEAAAARLAAFAGAARFAGLQPESRRVQSPSYPEYAVPVLRRINRLDIYTPGPVPIVREPGGHMSGRLYRAAGYLMRRPVVARLMSEYRPVRRHVEARFAGHFAQSNRRLADLAAHPLDLTGYDGIAASADVSDAA